MRVPDEELYNIALNEYKSLDELSHHENIIKAIDIFYNKSQELMLFVMEYIGEATDLENIV